MKTPPRGMLLILYWSIKAFPRQYPIYIITITLPISLVTFMKNRCFQKESVLLGYTYLIIQPKSSKENSLTPQIFKELTNDKPLIADDYAYAIYNNNHLIRSTSNYSFSDSIPLKRCPNRVRL